MESFTLNIATNSNASIPRQKKRKSSFRAKKRQAVKSLSTKLIKPAPKTQSESHAEPLSDEKGTTPITKDEPRASASSYSSRIDSQASPPADSPKAQVEISTGDAAQVPAFGTRRNPRTKTPKVTDSSVEQNALMEPHSMSTSDQIFASECTFDALQLDPRLAQILVSPIEAKGFAFKCPTRVQKLSILHVLQKKDVLVKSETGSGKTLAYLLPIIQILQSSQPRIHRIDGCVALIIVPTRELCLQIFDTLQLLLRSFVNLVPGVIVGGERKKAEKARLRKGISILIATPGRLLDHLTNTQAFQYAKLQFLVLDEADRLLDLGFGPQIGQILEKIRTKSAQTQNILVSATINSNVKDLASLSLQDPVLVDADEASIGDQSHPSTAFATPQQLKQYAITVPAKSRLCALSCFLREELMRTEKSFKIVVFFSTCDAVDFHFTLFNSCVWPTKRIDHEAMKEIQSLTNESNDCSRFFGREGRLFRLHGNIAQQERTTTFRAFCKASCGILFCTDVAARGVNLPTVHWIVQYDPPTEARDYVHRIGRTARSGMCGSSLLFLLPSEPEYLQYLEQNGLPKLSALSMEKLIARVSGKTYKHTTSSGQKLSSDLQFMFEQTVEKNSRLFHIASQAFHSFIRSYATHSADTRERIFQVRKLHFGHIARSFALREPPASTKIRQASKENASHRSTLEKRRLRHERDNVKRIKPSFHLRAQTAEFL
uniref:ATP-dependent RNA helicase n=1 Tax=Albugo laibachii Nc14 TaxID=890382 RepID=F0WJB4_9STRA|nr:DEAD/DEAH box RNA helicase putative [Albugo laibachii Nc14]|eukprot:CCA21361.1 DEAD/DEAH box RNA helicase putative [Albugo laibachii Nc14]